MTCVENEINCWLFHLLTALHCNFQGEELRITLAIIGEQKWEDALMEGKSPKAKQFVARTSNELKVLMKIGIGDNFYNLRYGK